jgi:toxin ParE1/3/4
MKLLEYEFTIVADRELDDIQDILADQYPDRDIRFTRRLRKTIEQIRAFPEIGRLFTEAVGLRFVVVWDYLVFYSVQPDLIRIERVIFGSRDIEALFSDD